MTYTFRKISQNTYNLIIYLSYDTEFSDELFNKLHQNKIDINNTLKKLIETSKKTIIIKNLIIVVTGSIVITLAISPPTHAEEKYSMSYLYGGTQTQQTQYIQNTQQSINTISPSYFDINSNGELVINAFSKSFIDYAHSQNLKVVPFLSNHWNRQAGITALTQNLDSIVSQVSSAIIQYNLDGINIDIENVTHNEKTLYTELVKKLRTSLPKDKEVSVAVAANPKGWTQGWHGSYDYTELAKYADYLMIMAYDEHYSGGEAGPVASIQFVEESIKYALSKTTSNRIVLGLPFFARIWNTDDSIKGQGMSLNLAKQLINVYQANITYNSEYQSPIAKFTISKNSPNFSVNGKKLTQGNYELWFENEQSLKEKLSLIQKYNLKGAGSWSLGQETADLWDYYSLYLNAQYFIDISNHYAKDHILNVFSNNLMFGTSSNTFSPNADITRAEVATIIARTLKLTELPDSFKFNDTKDHWAENDIKLVYNAGLISGYPDGTFRPNEKISRAELATILYNALDLEDSSTSDDSYFKDVPSYYWSYNEINTLANLGIIKGTSNSTFSPKENLSRAEMAILLDKIQDFIE